MKVLHVLPTRASSYGGPVRVAEAFARHGAAHGIDSELFPPEGVEPNPRLLFALSPPQLLALARAVERADLVHIHGLWTAPTTAAAVLALARRKPYLVTPHGMLDRWSMKRSALKKKLYATAAERHTLSRARALHFFNEEEAAEAQDAEVGRLPPHFLLPNGVDISAFSKLPARSELEARWPRARGHTLALFLGRIHPKKGFDVLVPALGALRDDRLLLLIAGPDEGGYRSDVERLAQAHAVQGKLLFTGPVEGDDKRALLGGADFFVLPSHQEGDSVAIKEALAAGLPVLISNRCHFPEVEREGAGLVVEDTVEAVRAALASFVQRPADRARQQRAAAKALAARYDSSHLAARLAEVYRALLKGERLP